MRIKRVLRQVQGCTDVKNIQFPVAPINYQGLVLKFKNLVFSEESLSFEKTMFFHRNVIVWWYHSLVADSHWPLSCGCMCKSTWSHIHTSTCCEDNYQWTILSVSTFTLLCCHHEQAWWIIDLEVMIFLLSIHLLSPLDWVSNHQLSTHILPPEPLHGLFFRRTALSVVCLFISG